MARRVEEDMRRAGLAINLEKSYVNYLNEIFQLGFVVDLAEGIFKVPIERWEALHASAEATHNSKGVRFQAPKIASLVETII
jgi:hypothetical protein